MKLFLGIFILTFLSVVQTQRERDEELPTNDIELIDGLTSDLISNDVEQIVVSTQPPERTTCYSCLQLRSERVGMFGNCNTRDAWQVQCSSGTCGTFRITRSNRDNLVNRLIDIGLLVAESIPAIPFTTELRRINNLNATALIKGCFTQRICDFTDSLDQRDRFNLANIRCRLCQGELCNSAGIVFIPNDENTQTLEQNLSTTEANIPTSSAKSRGYKRYKRNDNLNVLMALILIILSILNMKIIRVK